MKQLIKIKKNSKEEFYVFWELTDFCNQACSYCPPYLHNGFWASSVTGPTDEEIDKCVSSLCKISTERNVPLRVIISGGEPTLHSKLPDIITQIKKFNGHVTINTNGTRGVSWWENLPTLPDQVVISLHPEYYDSKKYRITDLISFLDNKVNFCFYVLAQSKNWPVIDQIIKDMPEEYKPLIELKMIHEKGTFDRKMTNYTEEQLSFIKNYPTKLNYKVKAPKTTAVYSDGSKIEYIAPSKILSSNEHFFQGWKCGVGIDNIVIYADGRVVGGVCGVTSLGRLSNFELSTEYSTCPRPSCTCLGDIIINKYDPNYQS
jgi:organic radical activating enzyme